MVKIALSQINPTVGDLRGNCAQIISSIRRAKKNNVDLIIFPELALVGYPPEDLLHKDYFIARNKYFLNVIRKECKGISAFVGFVDRKKSGIYNSCAIIQNQIIQDTYNKIFLPNYGVFDEKRYFTPGDTISIYTFKEYKFVVSICEDIWEDNFTHELQGKDLDFVINISASPFYLGKRFQRQKVLSGAATKMNSFLFYCNLIGGQDEIVFDGESKVFSDKGKVVACAKAFSEDFLIFNLDGKTHKSIRQREIEEEVVFNALRLGLVDYVKKNEFAKIIVGVSGGIDSAVVVSLACIALGKANVYALIMPSIYTSKGAFRDAKLICKNLGVKYHIVNIDRILKSYIKELKTILQGLGSSKVKENLQARIRGNILMAFSNKFGYLVLNTGNKSEVSCGYCTLYGDMVGGFGLLKDVPKLLVYKLAKYINRFSKTCIIPSLVIRRAPSAELKLNQKDTDTLPSYAVLDPILKLYVEKDFSLKKIAAKGFTKKIVEKIIKMVDSSEYKRRQAPVGVKITPRAFGKDRRMPITNKFFQ